MPKLKAATMLNTLSIALLAGVTVIALLRDTHAQQAPGQIDTAKIKNGAVTGEKIAALAVTGDKIAAAAIVRDKIALGAVGKDQLGPDAVETGKIKDAAVTRGKLGPNAVGKDQLGPDAVETGKIKDAAVTRGKLAANAVGKDQLDADAVETGKIKDAAVTRGKLAANAVGKDQLDTDAVDASKIKLASITADRLAADAKPRPPCLNTFTTPAGPMSQSGTGALVPSTELNCIPAGPQGPAGPAGPQGPASPSEVRAGAVAWTPGASGVQVSLSPAASKPFIAVVGVQDAIAGISSSMTYQCVFLSAQTSETNLGSFEVTLRKCADGQPVASNKQFTFSWMIAPK